MRPLHPSNAQKNRNEKRLIRRVQGQTEAPPPQVGDWMLAQDVDGSPILINVKTGKVQKVVEDGGN